MFTLLDLREETWLEENGRDIVVLSIMALVAIAIMVGIFFFIKKRRKKKIVTNTEINQPVKSSQVDDTP